MEQNVRLRLLYLIISIISILNQVKCNTQEKYVSATLNTKWSETPLALEASEFIFKHNPNSFWNFVNDISNADLDSLGSTDANQTIYNNVLEEARKYLTELELNFLKLSLSIRAYSPAIEASRKLAEETKSKCVTFVDVHGQITCNIDEIEALIRNADINKKPFIYRFDKTHPNTPTNSDLVVILYSNFGTPEFRTFNKKILSLYEKLQDNKFSYLLRHNTLQSNNRIRLSGYGVELDIKSSEYKAKDDTKVNEQDNTGANIGNRDDQNARDDEIQGFLFNKLKNLNPQLDNELNEFRKYLIESTQELAPLKAWHLQDLSIQAAQHILESENSEQLTTLIDLSQNFPLRARSLSRIGVKKDTKNNLLTHKRHFEATLNIEAGAGAFYINGLEIDFETNDVFSLTSKLTNEAKLLENLYKIGLNLEQIKALIYLDLNSKTLDYGIDIRDTSVQWVNDLENDKKYSYWPKSLQEILRPTYPGMLRSIARNFYNLLVIVDPSKDNAKALLKTLESFYVNDIPIRIGFVFVTNSESQVDGYKDPGVALFRAHNYIKQKSSAAKALSFLTDLYAKATKNEDLTADFIVKEFKRSYSRVSNYDDIFGVDSDFDEGRKLSMEYYNKIGLKKLPLVFLNGYPLKESEIEADSFEESVISKIMHLTQDIQMAYYHGRLQDGHNLIDWLMDKETIMPRLNQRILSNERTFIDVDNFDEETNNFVKSFKYFTQTNDPKQSFNPLSLWAVCDPDTEKGRVFLYEAINFHESNSYTRLTIIPQSVAEDANIIKKAIFYALDNFNNEQARLFIKKILREKFFNELKAGTKRFSDVDVKDLNLENIDEKIKNYNLTPLLSKYQSFNYRYFKFASSSDIALIANGWLLGPFDDNEEFIDSDFHLLDNFIRKTGLNQMKDHFQKWTNENSNKNIDYNDIMFKTYAILGKYSSGEKRTKVNTINNGFIHIKPKNDNYPYFDAVVILDPLTRFTQKIAPLLKALSEVTNINLAIYFNCRDKLSAAPLKNFYRYVLEPEMKFKNEKLIEPLAFFHNMPQTPVLTMNIHPPEGWMVEIVRSPFDLDNIYLKEIETNGAHGEYELDHLIIEGHCFDSMSGQSPRGLQFNLGTRSNPKIYDTIVMANLGYFQLKSSPGSWILELREGRSRDIYDIISHENTDSPSRKSTQVIIVMDSFESKVIKIKVSKKADKLSESLLDDKEDEQQGGIWNSISNTFGGGSSGGNKDLEDTEEDNVLNIFSVASGHLYERFLKIMMLTVLKNTKAKVKFWFLKNYLSPQLTKFLPYYSQKYNFDYELVQYKWPRWLHRQTEKQRIIWGYKILFLDVLFPLSIKKIIFVDADQVVRADLTELRDIDLQGAPYGYTPFCDSRKEMEGFRFWKSGYWAMHLGHRKYHISALYVVDLKKFRKIAAGDRLRGQYQGLSQDPNSLSNLDQDLPNNMIHQVNIFSLPQEWLYCDTWCSSDTLKYAKTIDLCNNPNTKEPKLQAAARIVPEWKDYDNEIKGLMEKWQQELKQNATQSTKTTIKDEDRHYEL